MRKSMLWTLIAGLLAFSPPRGWSADPQTAQKKASTGISRQLQELMVPARVDEQGRIVLREVIHAGHIPFEMEQIEAAEQVSMTAQPRPDLEGKTIERLLKPEDVYIYDTNGKEVPAKTVSERLKNWAPVFIQYSTPKFNSQGKKRELREGPDFIPPCMQLAKPDSLLLVAPCPVTSAVAINVVQIVVPSPPEYCQVPAAKRFSGQRETYSRETGYTLIMPVWETREKEIESKAGKIKIPYAVCRMFFESQVKLSDRSFSWAQVTRADGKPFDPAAKLSLVTEIGALPDDQPPDRAAFSATAKEYVAGLASAVDEEPIDPFYLKAFKDDVLVFNNVRALAPATPEVKPAPSPGAPKAPKEQL
jgi:hypothetical protein